MDRLTGATMDIAKENIEQLKRIFPDVFVEGKVDFDKLRQVLGEYVEESTENYSFTWNGKGQALKLAQTPTTGTLRPCREDSKNWDSTKNLYIEGDNLEVLKLLQKSYFAKVKMIYIDPPYNTGKDFVYKDDFRDSIQNYKEITGQVDGEGKRVSTNAETSGRYHTDWLNMMYPRLRLARNLLTEDGVIFISIDDNEVANLRKICDEIFGEDNFVTNLIWKSRSSISNDSEVSRNHNHTLVFCRSKEYLVFGGEAIDSSEYDNPDNDPRGSWKLVPIDANHVGGDTYYSIKNPYTNVEYYPPNGRIWAYNQDKMNELIAQNLIKFGKKDDSSPKRKLFYNDRIKKGDKKTPSSIMEDCGTTKDGTKIIMDLFENKKVFSYPKSIEFIKKLIEYAELKCNDFILDFFSGSSTTAHAVMQLNAEYNEKYQFIMVQLDENLDVSLKYAENEAKKVLENSIEFLDSINKPHKLTEIGKERIRRAGEKIKEEKGMLADELDIGFKVFKLDTSNILQWQPKEEKQDLEELKRQLMAMGQVIATGRTDLDVVYEIMLKMGLDLTYPVEELTFAGKKVYSVGTGALLICLADTVPLKIAEEMLKYKDINPELTRIVFSDKSFKNDSTKISVKERFTQAGFNQNAFMTI